MSATTEPLFPAWWGEFTLQEGQCGLWQVGPTRVWAQHLAREWRLAHDGGGDPADTTVSMELPCEAMGEAALTRFSIREPGERLRLTPLLADRSVISRPERPLVIPPWEDVTLYVSSPLWMRVEAVGPGITLQEFPLFRPSDTWFGPLTREGGLCYASSTLALTDPSGFPHTPQRAVTPVLIRNRAEESLTVERLNLPVPFLSLYRGADGTLWTQQVRLDRDEEKGELAMLQLDATAPEQAGGGERLAPPRRPVEKNLMVQAFSRLFG